MAAYDIPEGAVCIVDGCPLPPVGERPSRDAYILEDERGNPYTAFAAGEVDEIVCAVHMDQEEAP